VTDGQNNTIPNTRLAVSAVARKKSLRLIIFCFSNHEMAPQFAYFAIAIACFATYLKLPIGI